MSISDYNDFELNANILVNAKDDVDFKKRLLTEIESIYAKWIQILKWPEEIMKDQRENMHNKLRDGAEFIWKNAREVAGRKIFDKSDVINGEWEDCIYLGNFITCDEVSLEQYVCNENFDEPLRFLNEDIHTGDAYQSYASYIIFNVLKQSPPTKNAMFIPLTSKGTRMVPLLEGDKTSEDSISYDFSNLDT